MAKRPKKLRLTKRDYNVLRDANTFGLVVPELIAPYRFAGKSPEAIKSTLRRLYGWPPHFLYLRPEPLDARRVYYRLTSRGVTLIGASRSAARRRGRQSLIGRYAVAWFICCHRPHERTLLDRAGLKQLLVKPGRLPRAGFYLDESRPNQLGLGFALVDHGTHVIRMVRKAARLMQRFVESPAIRDFVVAGKFTLSVLTAGDQKRQELETGLHKRLPRQLSVPCWRLGIDVRRQLPFRVEVLVVPTLDHLIFRGEPTDE